MDIINKYEEADEMIRSVEVVIRPLAEAKNIDLDNTQLNIDSDTSEFVPTFFNKK